MKIKINILYVEFIILLILSNNNVVPTIKIKLMCRYISISVY